MDDIPFPGFWREDRHLSFFLDPSFSPKGWDTALKVFCMAILVVMTLKQTFLLPGPFPCRRGPTRALQRIIRNAAANSRSHTSVQRDKYKWSARVRRYRFCEGFAASAS